jgi:hypothetical protein
MAQRTLAAKDVLARVGVGRKRMRAISQHRQKDRRLSNPHGFPFQV